MQRAAIGRLSKRCRERHRTAIDLCADGRIADLRVDGVAEVDAIGPARQRNQPPLWRETKDLIVKQLQLGVLEEFLGVISLK